MKMENSLIDIVCNIQWQLEMDRCGLSNEQRKMNCYLTIVCKRNALSSACIHNSMENCQ